MEDTGEVRIVNKGDRSTEPQNLHLDPARDYHVFTFVVNIPLVDSLMDFVIDTSCNLTYSRH